MNSRTFSELCERRTLRITAVLCALGLAYGCSAGESGGGGGANGDSPEGGQGGAPIEIPTSSGGTGTTTHPLFGAGSYTGEDLSDPCNVAAFWEENSAIELYKGVVVIYEGTLWELTGTPTGGNWALPDCTPPGTGFCYEQFAWKNVGTCSEE